MSLREPNPGGAVEVGGDAAVALAELDGPDPCLSLLPWDRFSAWLHCVCVVGFDLELGQAVEVIYPPHTKLTDKEKTNICYLSFPDSNSGCLGDTQFCFRFRRSPGRKVSLCCFLDQLDRDLPVYLKKDPAYYYGYVYFRQVRDKSLKRGYFQKSLVLISKLPYVHLFHTMLKQIAPEYFEKSEAFLEAGLKVQPAGLIPVSLNRANIILDSPVGDLMLSSEKHIRFCWMFQDQLLSTSNWWPSLVRTLHRFGHFGAF